MWLFPIASVLRRMDNEDDEDFFLKSVDPKR